MPTPPPWCKLTHVAPPVVAGVVVCVVACYLEKYHPDATPDQAERARVAGAEEGVLGDMKDGSPNKLLNTLFLE